MGRSDSEGNDSMNHRIEARDDKQRRARQRAEIESAIAFYNSKGFDWSLIVEFLVRRMNESLPDDERRPWRKKCPH